MPHHLTSFQLGVLFLPQTLQSIPQFSCTEKSRSSRVIANRSFIVSFKYCCENLPPSSRLNFYIHVLCLGLRRPWQDDQDQAGHSLLER